MAIALTKFDPLFKSHLAGGIDRFFDDILDDITYSVPTKVRRRGPASNVRETDAGYEISLSVPGLTKKDFKITLENEVISVSYTKETDTAHALSQDSFKYNWKAPRGVVGEDITAKYNAGILTVTVNRPTEESAGIATIQVK